MILASASTTSSTPLSIVLKSRPKEALIFVRVGRMYAAPAKTRPLKAMTMCVIKSMVFSITLKAGMLQLQLGKKS